MNEERKDKRSLSGRVFERRRMGKERGEREENIFTNKFTQCYNHDLYLHITIIFNIILLQFSFKKKKPYKCNPLSLPKIIQSFSFI